MFIYIIRIRYRLVYCWKLNGKSIKAMATAKGLPSGRQRDINSLIFTPVLEPLQSLDNSLLQE